MALYGGYLWVQGRVQSQNYWEKLILGKLLSLRTSELEEQGAYLKAVIEESPLAFVVIDPQHRIQTCNLAFERLFLYNRQEALGKQINELLQTEAVANEMVGFQRFAEMGNTVHATTTRRRKDGVAIPVEVHAVPLGLNGKFIGLGALYQDVTERKRAEEQMKSAMQMKSDFISFATHQLRTPLAGIKWLLELAAQDKEASGETASLIQDARKSAERLIVMVNDLLDISRLESGKVTPAPTLTSLRELTETVLKDVHPQLLTQKHELLLHGGEDFAAVCIDSQFIRQVIVNLVSNAIKYTPSGGKINIDLSQRNGLIRWSIRDTGIGIPNRAQSQLFEKFFRADNVFAIETEGTGLGLYMVRPIRKVREAGSGTSPRKEKAARLPSKFRQRKLMETNGKQILLAKDDRFLRRACEMSLRQLGYTVLLAKDGEEALAIIQNSAPDCVARPPHAQAHRPRCSANR